MELPTPSQSLPSPTQSSPATPDWVFYIMGFMGAIIILLVTILVLVVKRR